MAEETLAMAKGISDYGIMIMIAAIFLALSALMMIGLFKWFKAIINNLIKRNDDVFGEMLTNLRDNGALLTALAEGHRTETQLRIRNLSGFAFDLSVEQVCRLIKKVREENHIADRAATAAKIRRLLHNLHEDRKSRFDPFSYNGRSISASCDAEWVEKVAQTVEGELYNPNGVDNGRAYTNVKMAYDDIKIDFYNRLNH